jgi:hypothetical protein
VRGFWPVPMTFTRSPPAGDERIFVEQEVDLDDADRFSRGIGFAMKMFTFPWTKLSMISFLPVSVS